MIRDDRDVPAQATAMVPEAAIQPASQSRGTPAPERPNVVLIQLDDLDTQLVTQMPAVQALLADEGVSFANAFAATPLCAPSRATLLRGQYAHNHGIRTNRGASETFRRLGHEASTIGTWLHDAGYATALFGKYLFSKDLNGYPGSADASHVPPGWDEWGAFVYGEEKGDGEADSGFYVDYELNENGRLVAYGHSPKDYSTDVLSAKAIEFVGRMAASSRPFFLYLTPFAPHKPYLPAPRHTEAFTDVRIPRSSAFNEADVSDKPAWIRTLPTLTPAQIDHLERDQRQQLRSLLAVDELVSSLIEALRTAGALDSTYVLFTSDHGLHRGEHRLLAGKTSAYGASARVPLLVRGPGVEAGRVVDALALNTDLAPTVAALAGVDVPDFVDGRSLAPFLGQEDSLAWRRAVLIEHAETGRRRLRRERSVTRDRVAAPGRNVAVPSYRALRTTELLYIESVTGERELYDLRADPDELTSAAETASPELLACLSGRLAELAECAGGRCRIAEDAPLADPPVS